MSTSISFPPETTTAKNRVGWGDKVAFLTTHSNFVPAHVDPNHRVDFVVMLVGGVAALCLHTVFLLLFYLEHVTPMVLFNVFSILLFLASVCHLYSTGRTLGAVVASACEVIAHQTLAIVCLGWGSGFQYYLFCVPAFVFLGRFSGPMVPLGVSLVNFGTLGWLYFRGQYLLDPHFPLSPSVEKAFYTLNIFSVAFLLAAFSVLHNRMSYRHERALLKANDEARRASQAKSDFLATMSHEFRTPMNAIIGFTELALRREKDGRSRRDLVRIQGASQALLTLINDVLDFSKIEAGKLEIVAEFFVLGELMHTLAEMFGPVTAEKKLEFLLVVDPDLPEVVRGDAMRVRQVLTNLVGNAVKFTQAGQIVVKVERSLYEPDFVSFSVKDSGTGIRPEQLARLFEPFTQADTTVQQNYGGTGLGLSICRRLVSLMGGEMKATSEWGRGSLFQFELPLISASEPPVRMMEPPTLPKSLRVMVIEDSPSLREVLQKILTSFGFEVEAVPRGDQGLERLVQGDKGFDLVLVDGELPQENALEIIALMQRHLAESSAPKVMLLVNHGWSESEEALSGAGVSKLVYKPVTPSAVMDALVEMWRGDESGPSPLTPGLEEMGPVLAGLKLLVVDDMDLNRELAREMLESVGARVDQASDGSEAVEMVSGGSYHAVLMDVNMPGMDGYRATRAIRSAGWRELPIIAMTAHALLGDRQKSLEAGMNDHVTKPISLESVVAALKLWLDPSCFRAVEGAEVESQSPGVPEGLRGLEGVVDLDSVLRRLNGKDALLKRLLGSFAARYRGISGEIGRWRGEELKLMIHQLKGAASNLGLSHVSRKCREIEAHLDEPARLSLLLAELAGAMEGVLGAVESLSPGENSIIHQDKAGTADWGELKERLEGNRLDASSWLEARREEALSRLGEDTYRELSKSIQALDFQRALEILRTNLEHREQ